MADAMKKLWDELENHTDGWNWYWLSYGEKCYAFAVVTAFPVDESDDAKMPPAGGRLEPHESKEQVWVGENGTEMLIDDWLCSIEQQSGDTICRFIAGAFADAKQRFRETELVNG